MKANVSRKSEYVTINHLARWKQLSGRGLDTRLRAHCGKPGCPGSLGVLQSIDSPTFSPDKVKAHYEHMLSMLENLDREYSMMDQREDLPEEIDRDKRRASLSDARSQVARVIDVARKLLDREVTNAVKREKQRTAMPDDVPRWVMRPERPPHEPGTSRDRRPHPLYYGFTDTGLRISYQGHRSKEGYRIGRRPFRGRKDGKDKLGWLGEETADRFEAFGQPAFPPCLIFCPMCGSLNDVGVPPGFELEEIDESLPDHRL